MVLKMSAARRLRQSSTNERPYATKRNSGLQEIRATSRAEDVLCSTTALLTSRNVQIAYGYRSPLTTANTRCPYRSTFVSPIPGISNKAARVSGLDPAMALKVLS